jgi:hypothetical protein
MLAFEVKNPIVRRDTSLLLLGVPGHCPGGRNLVRLALPLPLLGCFGLALAGVRLLKRGELLFHAAVIAGDTERRVGRCTLQIDVEPSPARRAGHLQEVTCTRS